MEGGLRDPHECHNIGVQKLLALPLPQPFSSAELSVTLSCTACTHDSDAFNWGMGPYGKGEMPHDIDFSFLSDALEWKANYMTLIRMGVVAT